jgi:Rrf2 family cysteine metabolism transcriptional repressor
MTFFMGFSFPFGEQIFLTLISPTADVNSTNDCKPRPLTSAQQRRSLKLTSPLEKEQYVFTLSARAAYGLAAALVLAEKRSQGPVQIREIAEQQSIPQHYLEQILVTLKRSGLVESFRGAQGGYALARGPSAIRIDEVLAALDGALAVVPEARRDDGLAFFWDELEQGIAGLMDLSLEDLLLRRQRAVGTLDFSI